MSRTVSWQVSIGYAAAPYRFDDEGKARAFYDQHKDTPSYLNPSKKSPAYLTKIVTTSTTVEKNR
jgi:hypothetical protein